MMRRLCCVGIAMALYLHAPHVEAVSPRQLVEIVDIENLAMSPDGRYVAFRTEQASIERNTYDTVWYVQRMDGAAPPRRIADGGVPLRGSAGNSEPVTPVWSSDGRWIYYRAVFDGRVEVWRAAVDGSEVHAVTSDSADVRDFWLSADSRTLYYSLGASRSAVEHAELNEYRRGIQLDERVPVGGQGLFRSGHVTGRPSTQRYTGTWFDRAGLLDAEPSRWRKLDLANGGLEDVAEHEVPGRAHSTPAATDGGTAPWLSVKEPGGGRIAHLTRVGEHPDLVFGTSVELSVSGSNQSRRPIVCHADLCKNRNIVGLAWRPTTDEIVFTTLDEDRGRAQTIYRWDVDSGAVVPVVRSEGLVSGGRNTATPCLVSFQALVCVAAEAARPPSLVRIDLASDNKEVLYAPNTALERDLRPSIQVESLSWRDADGQLYSGQLFSAAASGSGRAPLFVTYYSCTGFLRGGVGDEWPLASMSRHGISTLCINYAPLRNDAVDRFNQGLSAVESAVEMLSIRGDVDPSRVGMGGLSFGSEIALWVAMKSNLLSAVSVASPVVSPAYYLLGSLKGEEFVTGLRELWELGAPGETNDRWKTLSPALNLDRFTAPVLMQLSEQEYIQSLDYAIPLIHRRQADVYVFPDEPHQKFQPVHKLAAYERNLDWFRYWLQEYESGSSFKQAQYTHWRTLSAVPRTIDTD